MGLDTFLFRRKTDEKSIILAKLNNEGIDVEVAYWRKEYETTDWFIDRINQKGKIYEDCDEAEVTKEDLLDLITYLDEECRGNESDWRDNKEQNDWVDEQIKLIKQMIDETDWENEEIIFYAWW
jgi:hypothetical protein